MKPEHTCLPKRPRCRLSESWRCRRSAESTRRRRAKPAGCRRRCAKCWRCCSKGARVLTKPTNLVCGAKCEPILLRGLCTETTTGSKASAEVGGHVRGPPQRVLLPVTIRCSTYAHHILTNPEPFEF